MYTPLSTDVISSKTSEYFHIKHANEENSIHSTGYVQTTRLWKGHEIKYFFQTQFFLLFFKIYVLL